MITIASHDGQNNVIKAINKYLIQNIRTQEDIQMVFASLHGKLFALHNQHKPRYVIWPVSEYTQEVQDFISEYSVDVKVILIIDTEIPQQELNEYFNSRDNIAFIVDETITTEYKNTITKYGRMYDDDIYHASDLERNDKIVTLLSTDNDKNHRMLDGILYPNNKHDHKVVVVNNPKYDSPVNVGVFNYYDLAFILKTFDKVIDIDKIFQLESQACGIKYLNIENENIIDAVNNNTYSKDIDNLLERTYNHFIKEQLLPYLRK